MRQDQIHAAIRIVRREIRQWQEPVVGVVARESNRDPFRILISCLISLRTKDEVTSDLGILTDGKKRGFGVPTEQADASPLLAVA